MTKLESKKFANELIKKYESQIIDAVLNNDDKQAQDNYYQFTGCFDFLVSENLIDINSEEFIYIDK